MDIDVMARHMPGLIEFKKRVEALLDGAKAASGTAAEELSSQIDGLRAALGKVGDEVSALQIQRSSDDKRLSEIGEHVAALQVSKDEVESFSERLHAMLGWFEANHEGIDILLSIGDDFAEPKPAPAPEPAPVVEPAAVAEPAAEPEAALDQAPADQPIT